MKSLLFIYFIYNFIKNFLIIPEQTLLFDKFLDIIEIDKTNEIKNNEIINITKKNNHEIISQTLNNIIIINNFIFLFINILSINNVNENDNNLMIIYSFISKLLLTFFCFIFYYFNLELIFYNFINIIPSLFGDDVFFFISYNNSISKIKDKIKIASFFSYSIALGSLGKIIGLNLGVYFFLFIKKSYFIFYITSFVFILLIILIIIFILQINKLSFLHFKLIHLFSIKEFNNSCKSVLKNKKLKLLIFLNIIQIPFYVIEILILLEIKNEFKWSEKTISFYKTIESISSILTLLLLGKFKNIFNENKKFILFIELMICYLFFSMSFKNETLYFINSIINVSFLILNVLIKSEFANLGDEKIFFILYNISLTLSGFLNTFIYSLIYSKTFESSLLFYILTIKEFFILLISNFI